MTLLHSANTEIVDLKKLRKALSERDAPDKSLISKIDLLISRLASPVRVAILGGPRSGKSSLVNFLAGADLIPTSADSEGRPPVIVRYGDKPKTAAGWWSGIEVAEEGLRLESVTMHQPDFIEFRISSPILRSLSFLDMPSVEAGDAQTEQIRWVSSRADVIIWCTRADAEWRVEEHDVLEPAADRLKGRSLLAVTHKDTLEPAEATSLEAQVRAEAAELFKSIVLVSTTDAIQSSPGGDVVDEEAWKQSGGQQIASAVLGLARAVRVSEIKAARKMIKDGASPSSEKAAIDNNAQKQETASVPDDSEKGLSDGQNDDVGAVLAAVTAELDPNKQAIPQDTETVTESGALGVLQTRINQLIDYSADAEGFRDWGFLNAIVEMADDVSNAVAGRGALKEEAAWLRSQIDDAFGEFNMMQMGGTEQHCFDAATLLLQLSRDLAWGAARGEA